MTLYKHKTDGGAEYYSTKFITTPNGSKEGIAPFILRTDGRELEIFMSALTDQDIQLVIHSDKDLKLTKWEE